MKDMARSYNPTSPCLPRTCHTSSSPRKSSPKPPFIVSPSPTPCPIERRTPLQLTGKACHQSGESWEWIFNLDLQRGFKVTWPGLLPVPCLCRCPGLVTLPECIWASGWSLGHWSGWSVSHWSEWSVGHWSGQIGKTAVVGSAVDCINLVLDFRSLLRLSPYSSLRSSFGLIL